MYLQIQGRRRTTKKVKRENKHTVEIMSAWYEVCIAIIKVNSSSVSSKDYEYIHVSPNGTIMKS